tara:strand:+ start:790 stop:918 length:129 start_codon:yes stop_codon:yes gene_type:complete
MEEGETCSEKVMVPVDAAEELSEVFSSTKPKEKVDPRVGRVP